MFGFGKKPLDLDQDGLRQRLLDAFAKVDCPHVCKDLTASGIVGELRGDKGKLVVELLLPTPALKDKAKLEGDVTKAARAVLGDGPDIELVLKSGVRPAAGAPGGKTDLPGVKNVVLVASGKGGVGKSTVASNLAVALAELGCQVGLLDADIYGPSVPTMFGIGEGTRPGTVAGKDPDKPLIAPLERYGVKLMSIGFLVDATAPMVWRGPMIASAAMQLFKDVAWGELDYLVVDLPPGTGDVQLTISQQVMVAGAVVVSTPQDVALADVVRAKVMFDKVSIPVLGVVENMSYFDDPSGQRHELFGAGGGQAVADFAEAPLLGKLPLDPRARQWGDAGTPVVKAAPDLEVSKEMIRIAERLADRISVLHAARAATEGGGDLVIDRSGGQGRVRLPIAR